MGDQIGAEMRLGGPPLKVWNAPLVSGVHDELVVAALRGKGQTERGVWRTTYNGHHNAFRWWTSICSHWRGKVSWISCPSSGDLELEEVTIRVWRVSRRCQKTWREPPPSRCGHTGTRTSFERSIQKGEGWPYFSTPSVLLLFFVKSKAMSA